MSEEPRDNAPDNPGVVAPPPLIFAAALIAGLLDNRARRIPLPLPRAFSRTLGPVLVVKGSSLCVWGSLEMRRAGTNVDPYAPATVIVEGGPYRFTRNPIYLGFTAIYVGVSAWANALPPLLLLPGVLHVMRRGVIEREERYLEGKFGQQYLAYKSRVRRWL